MAKLTEQEFKKEVSSSRFRKLYFIYGDEKYLVKRYTELLINKVVGKKTSEFDFQSFNADVSVEEIFGAVEQIPIFSEYKCVCVKDYDIDAINEGDYKYLEQLCSSLPNNVVLIFTQPTLTSKKTQGGGEKKNGKTKKFISLTEKYGTALEIQKKGDIALEKQLVSWAEKNGCTLTQTNASKIISMCGNDMTTLKNEIDKLSAYANSSEITYEIIKILCVKNSEVRIFALSDCLSGNDFNGAYQQLYQLFEQNEKPEIILSVLSSVFIDMYRMRVALESGKTVSDVAKDFSYGKREFLLKNAARNSKKYSTQALKNILDTIIQTDIKLKNTSSEEQILLETLISRIIIIVQEENAH